MQTKSILAIDTASPSPGVTLLRGDRAFEESLPADRHASELLLAAIEACFARAKTSLSSCGRIAACSGPGSFTGVRVGLATAWVLGRALGCPVEPVSTLAAMAEASRAPGRMRVACALDAGRGEIVWEAFDLSGPRVTSLGPAARAPRESAGQAFAGLPAVALPAGVLNVDGPGAVPDISLSRALAAAVAREPSETAAGTLSALYSRPSAAEEKRGAS